VPLARRNAPLYVVNVITLVLLLPLLAVTTLPLVSEAGLPGSTTVVHNSAPTTVLAPEAALEGPPPPPDHASPVASSAIFVETAHMSEPPVLPPLPEINLPRPGSDDTELFSECVSDSASLEDKYDLERFSHDYFEYESGQKSIIVKGRLKKH